MLETTKKALAYYSQEFGAYSLPYYRMAEYAGYRSKVQAGVGMVAYSESVGFMKDLRGWTALDYATLHELAHQWWGNVYGARMQGRQFLNEGLAQYSTFMVFKDSQIPYGCGGSSPRRTTAIWPHAATKPWRSNRS